MKWLLIFALALTFCWSVFSSKVSFLSTKKTGTTEFTYPSEFNHGLPNQKLVALTFDADMTPSMMAQKTYWYNSKIIDILKQNQIPATLFITGLWAQHYPEITKSLSQNPLFEIANHSWSHPGFSPNCFNLASVSDSAKDEQFIKSQKILTDLTGKSPKLFRFPGGCHQTSDISLANKYGLTVVGWDVAGGDGFNPNSQSIVNKVASQVQNGSIVVLHLHGGPNAPQTANALPAIILNLRQKGYRFVTVSNMIKDSSVFSK